MEIWERDFEFLRVRTLVKTALKKDTLPDLQTILFLIGVQELGRIPKTKFTKEEKRDLMHIAVCTLSLIHISSLTLLRVTFYECIHLI